VAFISMLKIVPNKKILIRLIALAIIIFLIGFYPAYLQVLHALCGMVKGHPVRYL
jgi:hypothetical protein